MRLLLDPLDGGAFGPHDQPDHAVRYSNLHGRLARGVGHELAEGQGGVDVGLARGADLAEMVSR